MTTSVCALRCSRVAAPASSTSLYFDERVLDGDAVKEYEGVEVVVDKMSVPYLDGATIDFADTIEKQGFTIDNPNAAGSCACGDSFT
ncbi:hypothetical protein GCM10025876_01930 [Demequina litorisediminis]|uniref:Core domain-containing protein n=1 Tax=Demequina litorisediminis TaxID=1849022 RepID=A0ABQ6IB62_9MICO|nr:hypothetical protein GCM10025876_01930 [Demequina litorisediminis]